MMIVVIVMVIMQLKIVQAYVMAMLQKMLAVYVRAQRPTLVTVFKKVIA